MFRPEDIILHCLPPQSNYLCRTSFKLAPIKDNLARRYRNRSEKQISQCNFGVYVSSGFLNRYRFSDRHFPRQPKP